MDAAAEWTEEQLDALEKRIAGTYRQAYSEMRKKLDRHLAGYQKEREAVRRATDDEAYEAWLKSQAARASWLDSMATDLASHMVDARQEAMSMVGDFMPGIYAENANHAAFEVDSAVGADTAFILMDEGTVKVLMQENPRLLPKPTVNIPKDRRWNTQKVVSALTQGILQGESIPNIAKRLQTVTGMGYGSACQTARLATTCAENAGRVSSYERAKKLGIDLKQEWLATPDNRTRHSHRALDGERVEVGERFSNGCRYPGDPQGPAAEIYGCRCTLVGAVEGVDTSDAERWSRLPDGMTYEEWKGARSPTVRGSALLPLIVAGIDHEARGLHGVAGGDSGNVRMSRSEYAHVTSEINTWFHGRFEGRKMGTIQVGDYSYAFIIDEFGTYTITDKVKIK